MTWRHRSLIVFKLPNVYRGSLRIRFTAVSSSSFSTDRRPIPMPNFSIIATLKGCSENIGIPSNGTAAFIPSMILWIPPWVINSLQCGWSENNWSFSTGAVTRGRQWRQLSLLAKIEIENASKGAKSYGNLTRMKESRNESWRIAASYK